MVILRFPSYIGLVFHRAVFSRLFNHPGGTLARVFGARRFKSFIVSSSQLYEESAKSACGKSALPYVQ